VLVFGRVIQAAGGAVGMVLSRAIIRDIYGPDEAAKVIATLTMVLVSAPMLAPAIGGVLQDLFDWRSTFVFAGLVSLVVFVLILRELQETNRTQIPFAGVMDMVDGFRQLLKSPAYCGYAFHAAFSSMVFFSFISAAPYVMVNVMGRPPTEYGLYFIMVTFGFMCGNFVTSRLSVRVGINRLIVIGSCCAAVGLLFAYAFLWQGILTPVSLFLPVMITIFGNGMAMPNTQAGAINVFPQMAGTASGLSGFLQMAIAAVASQTVAIFHDGTAFPMIHFMTTGVILSIVAITIGFRFGSPYGLGTLAAEKALHSETLTAMQRRA
jgi:DHA1 family bicyclomycin/chloramphenicol resistance-like MFS transporter